MTTAATGADRADFVWHGHPIRSALALDLPRAASGAPLAPLTIAVDGELADPPARPLWRSAYTGFELHADRTGCWLARPDLRIRIQPDAIVLSATPDAIALEYLRTRVLALWLHLIAAPPIHASAVARDGVALAFLGASGAGKSTLCAAMRAHGCTPLADDLLPLAAGVEGVPVYPGHGGLHLWPDSARHLLGDIAQLPRIPAQGEKRRLAAPAQTRAARLRAVLLLRRGPVA
ncbi:MAG: hypothetical protein DYH17_11795, partial [Xanthomonadales bacterium PRO6]|nr:hypothetical protein [Xanthomonadales bacterium PRO6]